MTIKKNKLIPVFLAIATIFAQPVGAQTGVAESQPHIQDAIAARNAEDYVAFTAALEKAFALNPASYYTRHNLARGYAQSGRNDRAFEMLEQLADAKVDFGVADDALLAPLRDDPRFDALIDRLAKVTVPLNRSEHYYTVQRGDLVAEGIAWDAQTRRLFFGSMRNGEVYVLGEDQQLSKFAEVRHEGPLAAIGMTVDFERQLLWVVGTGFFLTEEFDADAPIWSGVFGFALATGELQHKYMRKEVGQGYNDVTVAPNGDLYLSGSEMGRVPAGGDAIEDLQLAEPVFGSNGIFVTPDGKHLIASSYPAAIVVVRLSDLDTWFLPSPENVPLYGIDGMYLHQGDLIAVQNGVRPWRLMRFELNDQLTAISRSTQLEFAHPASVPTTGAIVGDKIHYIGQAPTPDNVPAHLPAALHPFFGATVIMTAPLD